MIAYPNAKSLALLLSAAVVFAGGCPVPQPSDDVHKLVNDGQTLVKPVEGPKRTITGFSDALDCMDRLLESNGIMDYVMTVEDLKDSTGAAKADTRNMLLTAISKMTERSDAIKVLASGGTDTAIITQMKALAGDTSYATRVKPLYDIHGAVSQSDKNVVNEKTDIGANLSVGKNAIGADVVNQAGADVIGLDLQVLRTIDMSMIPGVVSSNQIVVTTSASGGGADARVGNLPALGLTFQMSMARAEGSGQALRNLVELASIELMGKLTRVPYWSCLSGVDPNQPDLKRMVSNWYHAMAREGQLVQYFQDRLFNRGFYRGPSDNKFNVELTQAIKDYQQAIGLEPNGKINEAFFTAFLNSRVPDPPKVAARPTPTATQIAKLDISFSDPGKTALKPGEQFQIVVKPDQDVNIACYYRTDANKIQRFFPNRFMTNSLVKASAPLQLPGSMPFKLFASKSGHPEQLACFSSPTSIMPGLPIAVRGTDFQDLSITSLDEVKDGMRQVAGAALGEQYFDIKVN